MGIRFVPSCTITLTRTGEVLGATDLLLQVVSLTLAGVPLPWAKARLLE